MTKVKTPLLSFTARRKLGDDIVFARRGGSTIAEKRPEPQDVRSPGQLSWRHMFQKVINLWHALSAAEKEAWESLGRRRHMTGYAWFVSQALRPNPGIYLPLQGGIMTGEILMGTNSIRGLPLPTGTGHAARKSYVDGRVTADILAHKGDASAHHIRYSDGEALAAAIAGGLSKVVWVDAAPLVMSSGNQTSGRDWTDLDLTAVTSTTARFAILWLDVHIDSYTNGLVYLAVRKNGTTPSYFPLCWGMLGAEHNKDNRTVVIVGMDSGQVIENLIGITGTAQADFVIALLGYIEGI